MKLKRRFYDSSINFKTLSVKRLVIIIVIGLVSAFIIYSFFYVLRESFRVMTFGYEQFPYILDEKDRNLYNIFFAGLSVVFANSIAINFLFSKPEKVLSKRNPKRKRILNDQIFLSFNFSYWFTKMGLVFWVFSMCCMDFDFSLYLGFISTLLLLVLYLESWKSLSMIFRKNRFKFQSIHLVIMVLLTFMLSRIDIINYKTLDEMSVKSNPKYDLPHSDFYSDISYLYYREIGLKAELHNDELRIFVFNKWATIDEIPAIVYAERASVREEMIPFLTVRISANRDIDLKYIKMIEAKLYSLNQHHIIYDVYNNDLLTSRFESKGIKKRIVKPVYSFELNNDYPIPPEPPKYSKEHFFNDTLHLSIIKSIKIDGLKISKERLVKKMKKHINRETLFRYSFTNETNYQTYITVLSSHNIAVHELRKSEQTIFKENIHDNDEDYRKEQYKLRDKYPMLIEEEIKF